METIFIIGYCLFMVSFYSTVLYGLFRVYRWFKYMMVESQIEEEIKKIFKQEY